ncbi:Glutathione S-transferase, domain-containing protein, partial [Teratosphaeria destructans]
PKPDRPLRILTFHNRTRQREACGRFFSCNSTITMAANDPPHILYQFHYSICSIMVRYAFALRGDAKDSAHEIRLKEESVDIVKAKEQLSEHYLCVPVLQSAAPVEKPISDSVEITKYLAGSYPTMIPKSHERPIKQMLSDLHGVSFFAFTFAGKPQSIEGSKKTLEEKLAAGVSDTYRKAIETKLKRLDESKLAALTPEASKKNEQYTQQLVSQLVSNLEASKTGYLFGLERPSALDAHLVVFVARMLDIKRDDMIPMQLKSYAEKAMGGKEWQDVMQGRRTVPG